MFWTNLKKYSWKLLGSLFMDTKLNGEIGVSLGRVCFLGILTILGILWFQSLVKHEAFPMPNGLMEAFYVLSGYVFGSKGVEAIRGFLSSKTEGEKKSEDL